MCSTVLAKRWPQNAGEPACCAASPRRQGKGGVFLGTPSWGRTTTETKTTISNAISVYCFLMCISQISDGSQFLCRLSDSKKRNARLAGDGFLLCWIAIVRNILPLVLLTHNPTRNEKIEARRAAAAGALLYFVIGYRISAFRCF